ncbi:MAG: diaminopimelate decarboxylase [Gammaproteobacteria bacterium]|nr:diaminopimelate decarboxylase [Gammaproteobacteria bacterium]MDE0252177.1 diaminopimelate decarboxylase [Gammaproteobacteria bacterium]MDE0402714.1 diaminopimelate decarboxylase [Gammaproteobacteria bacterium]MDE0646194.1 diaminopimelate decarboxylase [Gammaproteobacteria bacterium]
MSFYQTRGKLTFDGVDVVALAELVGTPVYVYSWSSIAQQLATIQRDLAPLNLHIHYAVKANSNLAILHRLEKHEIGFDVVSEGELSKVLQVGCDPSKVVFSGVGKSLDELSFALKVGVGCINIESNAELVRLIQIANQLNVIDTKIALRINPSVAIKSHHNISTANSTSKFGMLPDEIDHSIKLIAGNRHLTLTGISFHLGSEIHTIQPYCQALTVILDVADRLLSANFPVQHLNLGGGFAIPNQESEGFLFEELGKTLRHTLQGRNFTVHIEPGRFIVGQAGILIMRVEYVKENSVEDRPTYAIVDAGMNDFMRPMLYDAKPSVRSVTSKRSKPTKISIAGPICESTDVFCTDTMLTVEADDLLVLEDVGAYGFSLSSNYNTRPRIAELLIENGDIHIVRERETISDLCKLEKVKIHD